MIELCVNLGVLTFKTGVPLLKGFILLSYLYPHPSVPLFRWFRPYAWRSDRLKKGMSEEDVIDMTHFFGFVSPDASILPLSVVYLCSISAPCPISLLLSVPGQGRLCHRLQARYKIYRVSDCVSQNRFWGWLTIVKILYSLDTSSQSYVTVLPERQPVYVHSISSIHSKTEAEGTGSCYLKAAVRGICFAR